MVFERLGKSLYDIVKQNNYFGFSMKYMQFFAKQIIIFVAFFHQNQITHTDPKPENILTTNCVINLFPSKEDKFGFLKEKFLKSLILEMLPLIMNTIILSQTQDNIVLLKLLWVIQNGMRVVIFDVQLLSYLNFLAQFSIYYYINHIDY
ncbi:unnamed protein product [Paramecium sonneborni]|uniref:Protein kinase domain-containing protein n=1 Tax=Paramecium sonneborni TaxID=65129 RepID=A0A8S1PLW9_9CILI|nr:unnamed protein product [Paramecium sonneborni]